MSDANIGGILLTTGEYVHTVPYLEMRLRMALTGDARMPDDATWAKALADLLAHLREHPMQPRSEPASGPTAEPCDWEDAQHALSAVRAFDVGEWMELVMASDHPIAGRFDGRTITGVSLGARGMTCLVKRGPKEFDFSLDVDIALDSGSVNLTIAGLRTGDEYQWHFADLTLGEIRARERVLRIARTAIPRHPPHIAGLIDKGLWSIIGLETGGRTDASMIGITVDVDEAVLLGTGENATCIIPGKVRVHPDIIVPAVICIVVTDSETDEPNIPITTIHCFR